MAESQKRKMQGDDGGIKEKKRVPLVLDEERKTIVVGSRKSNLAVIQTKSIMAALSKAQPEVKLEMETMETLGDKILHIALPKIGEKSLFTKDLENALSEKRVDLLVHSLKDLPTTLPEGMAISTIYKRDDPHDCVIFHPKHAGKKLADLPKDSIIGTSSLRRVAQLKRRYPHLRFQSVRGNLNTRLRKLEQDALYDAIVLARAGIDRMGWADKCGQVLTEDECLYAIGQGAMTVEVRKDDKYTIALLAQLTHIPSLMACVAERCFMRTLNGGCSTPIGCYSKFDGDKYSLRGVVLNTDGSVRLDATVTETIRTNFPADDDESPASYAVSKSAIVVDARYAGELEKAEKCGELLAQQLKALGADEVLRDVRAQLPQVSNIHVPNASDKMKL